VIWLGLEGGVLATLGGREQQFGASEVGCTLLFCARYKHRQGRFGSVLVNPVFTQNLVSIVFCSFKEVKGRFASALDLFEGAGRCDGVIAASSGGSRAEVKRSGTSLEAAGLASYNRDEVLRDHKGQQNRSKATFSAIPKAQ
jgi:hypothetical protein